MSFVVCVCVLLFGDVCLLMMLLWSGVCCCVLVVAVGGRCGLSLYVRCSLFVVCCSLRVVRCVLCVVCVSLVLFVV